MGAVMSEQKEGLAFPTPPCSLWGQPFFHFFLPDFFFFSTFASAAKVQAQRRSRSRSLHFFMKSPLQGRSHGIAGGDYLCPLSLPAFRPRARIADLPASPKLSRQARASKSLSPVNKVRPCSSQKRRRSSGLAWTLR